MVFVSQHFFHHGPRRHWSEPDAVGHRPMRIWRHDAVVDAAEFIVYWAFALLFLIALEVGSLYFLLLFR